MPSLAHVGKAVTAPVETAFSGTAGSLLQDATQCFDQCNHIYQASGLSSAESLFWQNKIREFTLTVGLRLGGTVPASCRAHTLLHLLDTYDACLLLPHAKPDKISANQQHEQYAV